MAGGPSRPLTVVPGRRSSKVKRPPVSPFIVAVVLLVVEVVLALRSRAELGAHLVGAMLGMFVSVLILGWFRHALNKTRSSGNFAEWAFIIESSKAMWFCVLASWIIGTWHLWVAMYEWLRPA